MGLAMAKGGWRSAAIAMGSGGDRLRQLAQNGDAG
jgi:hypothetical protein